ncbi:hypothetical protein P12x_002916 [Tundrisphaera lichenicola]|uniref:hypothetical protein n=1 Tax=Tundrisphaera lichenicola TaxID=2029860 RepID=UPI003EBB2B1D
MRIPTLAVLSLMILPALADEPRSKTWTFDSDSTGTVARGFTVDSGEWKVTPSEGGNAFAQRAESPDDEFNVVLADSPTARDVDLSVRLSAFAGLDDRGGGVVWRAKDAKNYYVARYNHLEDNFRVYKVVDGKRSPELQNADIKHHDGWTKLRVTMKGDRIECYLDGKKYLEVRDDTFPGAGKVGLWSKADARTLFDDLTLTGL